MRIKRKIKVIGRRFNNIKSFRSITDSTEYCKNNSEWSTLAYVDGVVYLAKSYDNGVGIGR